MGKELVLWTVSHAPWGSFLFMFLYLATFCCRTTEFKEIWRGNKYAQGVCF